MRGTQQIFSQPAFWPTVSLVLMSLFAGLHLLSSLISPRIPGRWTEVWQWVRALEYAGWFIGYAALVPWAGYLPSTVVFSILLTLRAGYRNRVVLMAAVASAVVIVLLFKTFLQVKLPSGKVYGVLPDGLRQIMMTYF